MRNLGGRGRVTIEVAELKRDEEMKSLEKSW